MSALVSGATTINRIATAGWAIGSVVILEFATTPDRGHGVASGGVSVRSSGWNGKPGHGCGGTLNSCNLAVVG